MNCVYCGECNLGGDLSVKSERCLGHVSQFLKFQGIRADIFQDTWHVEWDFVQIKVAAVVINFLKKKQFLLSKEESSVFFLPHAHLFFNPAELLITSVL